jgi:hypothetical protein
MITERFPPRQQEFGQYYARMGAGLHYGAAIEGAIGTAQKIDASYLGPDVDLSDVLEAATKSYKVPILMTEAFFTNLSENIQKTCRKVDCAKLEGFRTPMNLYTPNVASIEGNYFDPSIREDVLEIELTDKQVTDLMFDKEGAEDPRENDERWKDLVDDWTETFEAALECYLGKRWDEAEPLLVDCLSGRPYDGPTKMMFLKVSAAGGKAPKSYSGYTVDVNEPYV